MALTMAYTGYQQQPFQPLGSLGNLGGLSSMQAGGLVQGDSLRMNTSPQAALVGSQTLSLNGSSMGSCGTQALTGSMSSPLSSMQQTYQGFTQPGCADNSPVRSPVKSTRNLQQDFPIPLNMASQNLAGLGWQSGLAYGVPQVSSSSAQSETSPQSGQVSLQTGLCSREGEKPSLSYSGNQDCVLQTNLMGGKLLVGIFDGHGQRGGQVANRVKDMFSEGGASFVGDFRSAVHQAVHTVESRLAGEFGSAIEDSGTTVTVALVDPGAQKVSIAHIGDSTALLVKSGGAIAFQTQDHKPPNGRLEYPGGSLGLGRAIGDTLARQSGLTSNPDVMCDLPFDQGGALIIGSDGVWDMLSKTQVASSAISSQPQQAADSLVDQAMKAWKCRGTHVDDTSCIVVRMGSSNGASADPLASSLSGLQFDPNSVSFGSYPTMSSPTHNMNNNMTGSVPLCSPLSPTANGTVRLPSSPGMPLNPWGPMPPSPMGSNGNFSPVRTIL